MILRRPRVLFAAPRGLLIAALISCVPATFACAGAGEDADTHAAPAPAVPDPTHPASSSPNAAASPPSVGALCCDSDVWRPDACAGPAQLVGTIADANACLHAGAKLLRCPPEHPWSCVGATEGRPQVCSCGAPRFVDSTDTFSFAAAVADVDAASQMAGAAPQPICCDHVDGDLCTTREAHFAPARDETPRGKLPNRDHMLRTEACEDTGGTWATCLAPRWRCERGDGDDAPLTCVCDEPRARHGGGRTR